MAVLLVVVVGCATNSSPQSAQTPTPGAPSKAGMQGGQARQAVARVVSVAPVTQGSVSLTFTYTGTAQARSQVSLSPKTSGRLQRVLVDVGSVVKEGDPIAALEQSTLQLAVQQAEANLTAAQAKLATVQAGGRPEDIASAQAALDSARAKFNQVKNGATAADLQAAQSAVDSAIAALASAKAKLETTKGGPTAADWASAQASVDSYAASMRSAQAKLSSVQAGPTASDIQAAQATVASTRASLTGAQDVYATAKDNLAAVSSKVNSVSQAQQNVDSAQAAYDSAVQKLNALLAGSTASDLQAAQTAYDQAKASFDAATAKISLMKQGVTAQDLQTAQSAVDQAQATLAAAQAKLAQLQAGPTDDDVAVAQAVVTQAQQNLALKQQPYTAQDLQSAQASVDVAKVNLATAKGALADATLVAPFSGIITQKLLSPGAMVSSQTPIVTLLGSDLEVPVNVEENRLSRLKEGLAVSITTAAYPSDTFAGKIASIAPSADPKSHTFLMKVIPDESGGKLKAGMFAEMKVTAEQHSDAVLVPRDAITTRTGKDVVFVAADGRAQMRQIIQGLPADGTIEVSSGVKAGEQVIVVGFDGLNDGDPVRPVQSGGDQSAQPQQQRGAPTKSGQ